MFMIILIEMCAGAILRPRILCVWHFDCSYMTVFLSPRIFVFAC